MLRGRARDPTRRAPWVPTRSPRNRGVLVRRRAPSSTPPRCLRALSASRAPRAHRGLAEREDRPGVTGQLQGRSRHRTSRMLGSDSDSPARPPPGPHARDASVRAMSTPHPPHLMSFSKSPVGRRPTDAAPDVIAVRPVASPASTPPASTGVHCRRDIVSMRPAGMGTSLGYPTADVSGVCDLHHTKTGRGGVRRPAP
jgi:hypothetical protein